jgi:uncharacterized protein
MSTRRFIAGAVCPQCRALDRIVVERSETGDQHRRCVACGHTDSMSGGASTEPATRLTRPREDRVAATPVRILDGSNRKS